MTRLPLLRSIVAAVALVAIGGRVATAADKPGIRAVTELFTSQGCSSCPAADNLLHTYASRPDLLVLSYSIDIWDKLGWKDTLANPKFTQRQKAYAKIRHDGKIYTPQLVINGGPHVVGSDREAIDRELAKIPQRDSPMWVPITTDRDGDVLVVNIPAQAGHAVAEATVWLVTYEQQVSVEIAHGENAGKTMSYANVVREIAPIGVWSGSSVSIRLPRATAGDGKSTLGAIVLQRGSAGSIIGAARLAASNTP